LLALAAETAAKHSTSLAARWVPGECSAFCDDLPKWVPAVSATLQAPANFAPSLPSDSNQRVAPSALFACCTLAATSDHLLLLPDCTEVPPQRPAPAHRTLSDTGSFFSTTRHHTNLARATKVARASASPFAFSEAPALGQLPTKHCLCSPHGGTAKVAKLLQPPPRFPLLSVPPQQTKVRAGSLAKVTHDSRLRPQGLPLARFRSRLAAAPGKQALPLARRVLLPVVQLLDLPRSDRAAHAAAWTLARGGFLRAGELLEH